MMNAMNHSDCPGSGEKCLWPNYHADLSAMESDGKFMNTGIDHVNIGKIRQTRLQSENGQLEIADGIKLVKERSSTLTWRLNHDLSNEVFDVNTEDLIENCRIICDLKSLLCRINEKGSVIVGLEDSKKFLKAVRDITGSVSSIEDADLIECYRKFVSKLETHFIKSCKTFDRAKVDSKQTIKNYFKEGKCRSV